jgi:ubiquinone/menaquinone biosynthesis C-methylase UbiE
MYGVREEIIDLRLDNSIDTHIDIDSYDERHGVTGLAASVSLWQFYEKSLRKLGVNLAGNALEIASGSGHLSLGLVGESPYQLIALSDISPRFMGLLLRKLRTTCHTPKAKVVPFLFDANKLPFAGEQFDLCIGNSVLHHFANFEVTLEESFRILKSGGCAIFGEPVMDTHVFMSLAAKMITGSCKISAFHPLTEYDLMIVDAIAKISNKKMRNLRSSRTELTNIEDKFVFPIGYMRILAKKIGFKRFECLTPEVTDFGIVIKKLFIQIFEQQKIELIKLDFFDFVFDGIGSTWGDVMKQDIKESFCLFAFVKS